LQRLGDGYAPAHIAIDNDDYECLQTCLELGSDSEVRNYKSETPQQLAYLCKSQEMVSCSLCDNAVTYMSDVSNLAGVVCCILCQLSSKEIIGEFGYFLGTAVSEVRCRKISA